LEKKSKNGFHSMRGSLGENILEKSSR
jgi:hypothetical protein